MPRAGRCSGCSRRTSSSGRPLRITHLGTAARIGQASPGALSVAGYSAPEVAHRAIVTGKEDVYTLGALLYRVLVGATVPEAGPELAALGTLARLPGAPQLLDTALAPVEERADLETFYRQLSPSRSAARGGCSGWNSPTALPSG